MSRRGMPRGRGGFRSNYGNNYNKPPFVPHRSFDIIQCENIFPRVNPLPDDKALAETLVKRVQELTPSAQEQAALLNLVTKVTSALDNLIVAPILFEAAQLEEIRLVGSHKKGTIMAGHCVADIVVILKTLPTLEAVQALSDKLLESLQSADPNEHFMIQPNDGGFKIRCPDASVDILIATIMPNMKLLDSKIHLDREILQGNLVATRHARWFEETASHSSVKCLVRLLRDIRNRFEGFKSLTVWMIDVLAHYAVFNSHTGAPLSLNAAFRRCFQLLASGLFIQGACGIPDPCKGPTSCLHIALTHEQQDEVCYTAQTLVRILSHGGYRAILGYDTIPDGSVATSLTVWDGIVVTPSIKAYEPRDESKDEDDTTIELTTDDVMDVSADK